MSAQAALKFESKFECGTPGVIYDPGVVAQDASTPVLPKFLEKDVAHKPAKILAFNSPKIIESEIVTAKRDRDFQVIEAVVAIRYAFPLDGIQRKRRVLATLRTGADQSHENIRARLMSQAEKFFVLMVNSGKESMFAPIKIS